MYERGGRGANSKLGMRSKNSDVVVYSSTSIGTAISQGAGLYANEIQNARDEMEREYGNIVSQVNLSVAKLAKHTLGAYGDETVYLSSEYAKKPGLTDVMKEAANKGFHPKIGNKTGAEAVTSHELGHYLADRAMAKAKINEKEIVKRASKKVGVKVNNMAEKISEYARYNYAETIAEASADVFCNGRKASKESIAIMNEIKSILK